MGFLPTFCRHNYETLLIAPAKDSAPSGALWRLHAYWIGMPVEIINCRNQAYIHQWVKSRTTLPGVLPVNSPS